MQSANPSALLAVFYSTRMSLSGRLRFFLKFPTHTDDSPAIVVPNYPQKLKQLKSSGQKSDRSNHFLRLKTRSTSPSATNAEPAAITSKTTFNPTASAA